MEALLEVIGPFVPNVLGSDHAQPLVLVGVQAKVLVEDNVHCR